jgi:16S rRNA (cytidine1402-2'-O)-methyltransferase
MSTDDMGRLYVVSTPIGNLKDITLRALEILNEVDCIICEDTRVTLKLLNTYGIKKPLVSFHSRSRDSSLRKIVNILMKGQSMALVTDSGTPVISDPGTKLVSSVLEKGVDIVPVPGPSAAHTALAVSGISASEYTFLGFLSNKGSRRRKKFEDLKKMRTVFVFYESPHRILPFLEDAADIFGNTACCVAKEMTKMFEKFYRGGIKDIVKILKNDTIKGEYTVVIDNREGEEKN